MILQVGGEDISTPMYGPPRVLHLNPEVQSSVKAGLVMRTPRHVGAGDTTVIEAVPSEVVKSDDCARLASEHPRIN